MSWSAVFIRLLREFWKRSKVQMHEYVYKHTEMVTIIGLDCTTWTPCSSVRWLRILEWSNSTYHALLDAGAVPCLLSDALACVSSQYEMTPCNPYSKISETLHASLRCLKTYNVLTALSRLERRFCIALLRGTIYKCSYKIRWDKIR